MNKYAKTFILLAALSGLLLFFGDTLGARYGGGNSFLWLFGGIAIVMNLVGYFFSDRIALAAARAQPVTEQQAPQLHAIARELASRAGQPVPRLYVSPSPQLNAFATGRNPRHAAVSVNQGLLEALEPDELEAVLAHELQHVYNRDILIAAVAAMLATVITLLARIAMWGAILGGGGRDREGGGLGGLLMIIFAPIAAMLIQFAVSRSRETAADRTGAALCGKPLALARALAKIERAGRHPTMWRRGGTPAETNPAFAHMYISAPFSGRAFMKLFSTHPPVEERIAALEGMARDMGQLAPYEHALQ